MIQSRNLYENSFITRKTIMILEERMKTFVFLFALTLIVLAAAIITPCYCSTYAGTYNGEFGAIQVLPSITFSPPTGSSYTVGDVPQHAGFEQTYGNSTLSNGFLYNSGNLTLGLIVNVDGNPYSSKGSEVFPLGSFDTVLTSVSYKASWLDQPVIIYAGNIGNPNALSTLSYNLSLANIPEGHRQIIVTASEEGYITNITDYWSFSASTSGVFNFNVVPLSISFISPTEGQVFNSTGTFAGLIPLAFNVNGAPTWLAYSLDNLASNEIEGNTTLVGLTNGHYSLTIYAEDSFGNIGKSEPIDFTIAEPEPVHTFPTVTVATISVVVVAVVGISFAVLYHRKHRKTR